MSMRASQVIAHKDPTSSFGIKMRIEEVGGNRKRVTVSCLRHLYFGKKKKMRFSRGEIVFYRSKTANVEVKEVKVDGDVRTLMVNTEKAVQPGDINDPLPKKGL
ncbi:hypothetical protein E2C01_079682 [Portunus trituberculatus]|uniref:Uncharacterized protein n=1 Tax=Portunus trituberculatus TaxID=210409 RepID=A0A5B7IW95_PORTR|nr:hypothetical protein [Portunus trituberculatus]